MKDVVIVEGWISKNTGDLEIDSCPAICTNSNLIRNYLKTHMDGIWDRGDRDYDHGLWDWNQAFPDERSICEVLKELSEWHEFDVYLTEAVWTSGEWDIADPFNSFFPSAQILIDWKTM